MIRILLAFAIVITLLGVALSSEASAATNTTCQPRKPAGATGYWRYRLIKGRQCWYPSRRGSRSERRVQRIIVEVYRADQHNPQDAALDEAELTAARQNPPSLLPNFLPYIPNPLAPITREFELRFRGTQ